MRWRPSRNARTGGAVGFVAGWAVSADLAGRGCCHHECKAAFTLVGAAHNPPTHTVVLGAQGGADIVWLAQVARRLRSFAELGVPFAMSY